jgi:hypothetical protein
MIDMRYKPRFLPQVSAPYTIMLQKLDDDGVDYDIVEIDPNELEPLQGITFSDEVENVNLNDMNPIWMSNNNKVLDGHHRMVRGLLDNKKLKAIRINLNEKDAARVLNKIHDIYEYEQAHGMEETTNDEVINDENQASAGVSQSEFLASLEEDNMTIQQEKSEGNEKTIIAYRKEPIKKNSVVGNFFTLNPIDGFTKYQIDFDNLLDTNELGVTYKDGQQPVDILAKIWFPHINFEKISSQYNTDSNNIKSKAIAEKAMKLGYDGVKYGDKIIQGLK